MRVDFRCDGCGAELVAERSQKTIGCPYCGSSSVIERPHGHGPSPAFALGFGLDQRAASEHVGSWARRRGFFTRSDFKRARPERIRGVYVPVRLYGAEVHCAYAAEIGEQYEKTVWKKDGVGRETRTEWRELRSWFACHVGDVLVTASRELSNEQLEGIEPFDTDELRAYEAGLIAGWPAEEASLDDEASLALARKETEARLRSRLWGFLPGDEQRRLSFETHFERESMELALLPVWCFVLRHSRGERFERVWVNGRTGKVHGDAPFDWVKLFALVVLALAAVVLGIIGLRAL